MNHLSQESSPYLLQHAKNPIHWYPWGEAAFEAAQKTNKPIFLSVGYSSCYWCHFMEKDSFEKQDVANLLNAHFIAIKVDREEFPDVDHYYMTALTTISQYGGWPMSLFLTSDGQPFFGASTIQHDQFIRVLGQIAALWGSERQQIQEDGAHFSTLVSQAVAPRFVQKKSDLDSLLSRFYDDISRRFDTTWGGFEGAPKFPMTSHFQLLMELSKKPDFSEAKSMIITTLDGMAKGGMHDWISGGFHRYSVDERWEVPHFEKMLYDNASIAGLYLEGFLQTGKAHYVQIAKRTLDFVLMHLTGAHGGFFSALDAGEVGQEGEFYRWTSQEVSDSLSVSEMAFCNAYLGMDQSPNFEHQYYLTRISGDISETIQHPLFPKICDRLASLRAKRVPPFCDDKIITAWNGMMIAAMAKGFQILRDQRYLIAAQRAAQFIKDSLVLPDKLGRCWRINRVSGEASLEDYAFLIEGLLELLSCHPDPALLGWISELQAQQQNLFWDADHQIFTMNSRHLHLLPVRMAMLSDSALAAANSISIANLIKFSALSGQASFKIQATAMIDTLFGLAESQPMGYSAFILSALKS